VIVIQSKRSLRGEGSGRAALCERFLRCNNRALGSLPYQAALRVPFQHRSPFPETLTFVRNGFRLN
jgi:hypothetical protein